MPPKRSITLTEAELRLMKLLWTRGESAVADLVGALPEGEALAYTSVLTTVRILEQKGYVVHRQEGRAFLYSPCVAEHEASLSEVRHVLKRFFGDSREQLLLSLLGDGELSAAELQRLKDAIAAAPEDPKQPRMQTVQGDQLGASQGRRRSTVAGSASERFREGV